MVKLLDAIWYSGCISCIGQQLWYFVDAPGHGTAIFHGRHYLGWSTAESAQQPADDAKTPAPAAQQQPAAEAEQAAAAWRVAAAQLPGSEADDADSTPVVCRTRSRSRGAAGDSITGDGGAGDSAAAAADGGSSAAGTRRRAESPVGVRGRLSVELPTDPSAAGAQAVSGAESPGTPSLQRGRQGGSRPAELRQQLALRGVAAASSPGRASPGKSPSKGTAASRPAFGEEPLEHVIGFRSQSTGLVQSQTVACIQLSMCVRLILRLVLNVFRMFWGG